MSIQIERERERERFSFKKRKFKNIKKMNATDLGDEPAKAGMMENLRVKFAR